ncbi:hypothetical protein Ocin01_18232 [Orchesella cincta]|uniref:Uncharacterized protein n=1 Tax=Orchesella cincta TaxID=48709 RepID=A0A1D2M642_ORCCI|nr:hypothetical protein Ocin01_18232 [Orchesella cincta]
MSHQNSTVIVSPTVMEVVVDDKHFISADEFSLASDWDDLVVATRGGGDAREAQPNTDVLKWEGDSMYVKFEPLLCSKQLVEGGGGDCFSNAFESQMQTGQPAGGVAGSPYNPDNRVEDSPSHSRKHSLAMDDVESSLYTTAVESSTDSFGQSQRNSHPPNPTILVEENEEVNGNIFGSSVDDTPDQLHDYEGFRNGLVTKIVFSNSNLLLLPAPARILERNKFENGGRSSPSRMILLFLEAFSKGVVVGTPEKTAVIINQTFEKSPEAQPSKLHELNGTFNITPATPPEFLNVTQILARHDELDEDEELAEEETSFSRFFSNGR